MNVAGTFNAGANNGLYKLNRVEGFLTVEDGAAASSTPGSGTLTVASGAQLEVDNGPGPASH